MRVRVGASALAAAAAAALLLVSSAPRGAKSFDLASARPVDLTHSFDSQTLYWPTSPTRFALQTLADGPTPGGWFYAANSFCAPEHGGTHLDAPYHFSRSGWTSDRIPVARLIAPAAVIDVQKSAAADNDYRLTRRDLEAWEAAHGKVPEGSIVLLRTGWSARWPDRKRYLGSDAPGDASNLHFPSFGEEAARILAVDRKAAALGIDTASIDYGPSTDFPVHRLTAAANVAGLENLTGLAELPPTGSWILALPMKIAGGSGGPLRVVALLPPE